MLTSILPFFLLLPLLGYVISLFIPAKNETFISRFAFGTMGLHLFSSLGFVGLWLSRGLPSINLREWSLYKNPHYDFFIAFYFDHISAVYLLVGSFLTFLVTLYSRYYLHRESGYKRFFNTILFFFLGYNLVILSGNLETLLIGWEILGLSSFLLIAFYRDRYVPVKNAVKVFSIYRIGDVGLILAMWMSHHLWHANITFARLNNYELVSEHLQRHTLIGVFVSLMILVSAAAKSAQLPFSSWLPRAMEGPTPSSAIFYGSLSVHLGVFLMLRTFPFWEHQLSVRIMIGLMGLTTSFLASGITRVQSSVKSQIAYASIAQIGLIFVEIAFGLNTLALIHFAGNAFLRTYQLLVSPSVVSYLIRQQYYHFVPRVPAFEGKWPKRFRYTFYTFCLKEGNLDAFMYRYLWNPLKLAGKQFDYLTVDRAFYIFTPIFVLGFMAQYFNAHLPEQFSHYLPIGFSLIGLLLVLKAFTERRRVELSWTLVMMNHCWVALAISFNEKVTMHQIGLYLSGILLAGFAGIIVLKRLRRLEGDIDLNRFHGNSYIHPRIALWFLLCSLGLSGFPITPAFIGEDLVFSHIHANQLTLAFITALSLILDGLAIIRIYARVFLGPHVKSQYDMAYRSS